jgi:DNA-binding CsgD family transcriptional regulator
MLWQDRLALLWDDWGLRWCLEGLGAIALACQEAACAARFLGAAAAHCQRMGVDYTPAQQAHINQMIEQVRISLGETALWNAWAAGWRWPAAEARAAGIRFAREIALRPRPEKVASDPALGLTRRELEVVRLVATGRSNQEIADMLCISIPTVKRHLTNVFGKVSLPSRSALTAYAIRHGLV